MCGICNNTRRDNSIICVVETPADVLAIEQSGTYQGKYFVLLGHLSPIDGIGPEDIGIDQLISLLQKESASENSPRDDDVTADTNNDVIKEIILATNPTVEGEATAYYISERAKNYHVIVSRIAHGVPLGGELEFIDGGTLAHAFASRRNF